MKLNNYKNIFLAGLLVLTACKPEVDVAPATSGSADFSRFIAVGNSLTSGFADGGLYREGQLSSFPSIIAQQMQAVGGGAFTQPLFSEEHANGSGYIKLQKFNSDGTPVTVNETSKLAVRGVVAVPVSATATTNVTVYDKYTGDINNYGVPGIKLADATNPIYGNYNGYFERLLPNTTPANTTAYLDFVTAKPYTFFSNWLGNNDALGYATSGGAGDVLTPKATFTALYNQVIAKLTSGGQKGVVATIPDVTAIPYFNTVTTGAILAGVQKANPAATALYVSARNSADDANGIGYTTRTATSADLVTLTFPISKIGTLVATPAGMLPYGLTPLTPIENQYILDPNEISLVKGYVDAYNTTIKAVAASKGLALVDMYTFLNNLKQKGLLINGVSLNSGFISGGVFSLDGVHLTPRGYAVVANEFIKAINTQYGSNIPQANVSAYRGVKFP
jgi:lysophospholipase L1-like esterase